MTELRYVYAVCDRLDAPLAADLTGVGGDPPHLISHVGLTAVVGHVPAEQFSERALRRNLEDLDWLSGTARAHQAVIASLISVTSPLPLRLATVFHDDSGVRTMLEEEGERFRASLERLRDRVEWGVKVSVEAPSSTGGGDAPSRASGPSNGGRRERPSPTSLASGSGRDYLRRRRAERTDRDDAWRQAETVAQSLHDELARRADDNRIHPPQNSELSRASGRNVLNSAYLVRRSEAESFVERVKLSAERAPELRVELTGPWAAYSFSTPPQERSDAQQTAGETR
ncbi:GvpL/GvpF family gas vesicle protein [Streptomyces sp. NPDC046716]|uniref:GvpL/GvpF family gas vesicle protein n=1 Tax=Streptomyces sp. NPDC046716 TaxID=3157093 RepID=UPI0033FBDB69